MFHSLLQVVSILGFVCSAAKNKTSIDLPSLPPREKLNHHRLIFSSKFNSTCFSQKNIPRNLWITASSLTKATLPFHLKGLIARNSGWCIHVVDDHNMVSFMKHVFSGTKLLWAFDLISPELGASRADIWRYAVLWTYGGVYIDLDADLMSPFDEVLIRSLLISHMILYITKLLTRSNCRS